MTEELLLKLKMLPESPGCYLMKSAGKIIYVGKAVNLRSRVRSYFRASEAHSPKVCAMIEKIDDFELMLCAGNLEALILECNLIKKHKPYYNILLKDDKHYPYIRVDLKEPFPQVTLERRMQKDGARYFGPYKSAEAVRQVMDALRGVFPIRSCNKSLPLKKPGRPCLNYQIGRCLAPCAAECGEKRYRQVIDGVLKFLNGHYQEIAAGLEEEMREASRALRYEQAAALRDKVKDVRNLMEKQNMIQTGGGQQDVIGISQDGLDAMVQVLFVRAGKMTGGAQFLLPREGAEDPREVLSAFILQYYQNAAMIPRSVLLADLPDSMMMEAWLRSVKGGAVTIACPKRGAKLALVRMAESNALDALQKRNAREAILKERTTGACEALGKLLMLKQTPRRIEGYDISNTQGVLSVGAMVVFMDGVPQKKEYRRFKIKTVQGANDFASHQEVMLRRMRRAVQERAEREMRGLPPEGGRFSELPDLILIDGGEQQLRFARDAVLSLGLDIPMFGLAEETDGIYLPGRSEPMIPDLHSPELHLIRRIRDEAHRFGITYHRSLRDRTSLHSRLEEIPGIGRQRVRVLLKRFQSLKAIKEASLEELRGVKGMNLTAARAVLAWAGRGDADDARETLLTQQSAQGEHNRAQNTDEEQHIRQNN